MGLADFETGAGQREAERQGDRLEGVEVGEHVRDVVAAIGQDGAGQQPLLAGEVDVDHARGAVEHVAEVLDLAGIPGQDAVNDLQLGDVAEHALHREHVRGVPGGELRDVLERRAAVEHEGEVRDGVEVPTLDELEVGEAGSALEHALERGRVHDGLAVHVARGGADVHRVVPVLQARDGDELAAGLAGVVGGLHGIGRVLGDRVVARQRAEQTLDAIGEVYLHVAQVGAHEVVEAGEPVLGVDDEEVTDELDVPDVAALVDVVVIAGDVDEPRELVPLLGDEGLVVVVVVGVVVHADDERVRVGHELPPREAVGREDVTTGLLDAPHVGVDEVLGGLELAARGVDADEGVGGAEPGDVAAVARPTTGGGAQAVEVLALDDVAGARVDHVDGVEAEAAVLEQALDAHDDLLERAGVGEHVGGVDVDLARAAVRVAVVHLPLGEVDEVQTRGTHEHARELVGGVHGCLDGDLPPAQAVGVGHAGAAREHVAEVENVRDIPARQVVGVGDAGAALEHVGEVHGVRGLPGQVEGHVEVTHVLERVAEVGDLRDVPQRHRRDARESRAILEGTGHVDEVDGVPGVHARDALQGALAVEGVLEAGDRRSSSSRSTGW